MVLKPIHTLTPEVGKQYLVYQDHEAAPMFDSPEDAKRGRLTVYRAHAEGLNVLKEPGFCVVEFGGAYHEDVSGEGWGPFVDIADWYFLAANDYETPVWPTHWAMEISEGPKRYWLFLDDEREPADKPPMPELAGMDQVTARNFETFKLVVEARGLPWFVSFDHDLGATEDGLPLKTGMDCAHWLVDWVLDDPHRFNTNFEFAVHSQNPAGARNIEGLLRPFINHMWGR